MVENLKKLHFYGDGVSNLVNDGRKLVTVRSALKDYEKGEVVEGVFTNDSVHGDSKAELHILHQEEQALKDILPGILLLDGFLSDQHAAEVMPAYYPDIDWNVATPVAWTLFMLEDHFQGKQKMDQYLLQQPELRYEGGYSGLLKDSHRFHHLFLSYYFWLVDHHGYLPKQYPSELAARELVDPDRISEMLALLALAEKESNSEQQNWLMHHFRIGDIPSELGF